MKMNEIVAQFKDMIPRGSALWLTSKCYGDDSIGLVDSALFHHLNPPHENILCHQMEEGFIAVVSPEFDDYEVQGLITNAELMKKIYKDPK